MKRWWLLPLCGLLFLAGCGQEEKGANKDRDKPVPAQNPPAPKGDK